jgi:hypothetical protein
MVRTQVYLTSEERTALEAISRDLGKNQSELVRTAIDDLIAKYSRRRRDGVLARLSGIWRDRDDLPDFSALRKECDLGR